MIKMKKSGFLLTEVLLALGIFSVLLLAFSYLFLISLSSSYYSGQEVQAQALLSENLEATRIVRQESWDNLINGTFYPHFENGHWSLMATTSAETIGPFTRKIEITDCYRNEQGELVPEPGRLDPSTKKIISSLSWQGAIAKTASATAYLTRYLDNLVWKQTLKEEFDQAEMDLIHTIDPPLEDGEFELLGGCVAGDPESLIYDDQFRNGWRVNCTGLPFWKWLLCQFLQFFSNASVDPASTTYTWNGSAKSIKITLKPSGWSWIRIFNYEGVCTKGFKNLHFYGYNPSTEEITFYLTAHYGEWETSLITLPPGVWTEVSLDYDTLEDYENDLEDLYFHKSIPSGSPNLVFYLDQIELTGGVGGYFTKGTLTSSVFDAGQSSAFNRIEFDAEIPLNTSVGFQLAVADSPDGPWHFTGPDGTDQENDLYTDPEGEGIRVPGNVGRYARYKAYLKSEDGENTPIVYEVRLNYSP